jgi:NADPH-dependent 2,4-dienoyl-CoA reductase/sulfur reductase-like enzyme
MFRNVAARGRVPELPEGKGMRNYDLVVIGGGTAGLVSAAGAASLGFFPEYVSW